MKPLSRDPDSRYPVLVVGYCTRPLADAIRRSRIWSKDRFVFLDFFGDMDQKTSVQNFSVARDFGRGFSETDLKKTIQELVPRFGGFDGVIYDSGVENRPGLLEWLKEQGVSILGNDPEVLRASRNPDIVLPVAARHGARVPETFVVWDGGLCRRVRVRAVCREKVGEGIRCPHRPKGVTAEPEERVFVAADHGALSELGSWRTGSRGDDARPIRGLWEQPRRRWLLKPTFSAGGSGIRFLEASKGDRLWLGAKPDRGGTGGGTGGGKGPCGFPAYVIQEFVDGTSCSAVFVADGRRAEVIGVSRQLIGDPDFGGRGFAYCGNIIPVDVPMGSAAEEIERLCAGLTADLGLKGVNCIDFILKDERVWFLEINPRYSASMELLEIYRDPSFSLIDIHFKAVGANVVGREAADVKGIGVKALNGEGADGRAVGTMVARGGADGAEVMDTNAVVGEGVGARALRGRVVEERKVSGRNRADSGEVLDDEDFALLKREFEWACAHRTGGRRFWTVGKAIVYATKDVVIPRDVPERWLAQGIRDVPFPGDVIPAGSPVCTVLAYISLRHAGHAGRECMRTLRLKAAEVWRDLDE